MLVNFVLLVPFERQLVDAVLGSTTNCARLNRVVPSRRKCAAGRASRLAARSRRRRSECARLGVGLQRLVADSDAAVAREQRARILPAGSSPAS